MRYFFGLMLGLTLTGSALASIFSWKQVSAESWLVADSDGKIIQGEKIDDVRSIASITKLMTTMVVVDAAQDMDEVLAVKHSTGLRKFTRAELIQLAMVRSDNVAADALCRYYPTGYDACIDAMNAKAQALGLEKTRFVDATGLDSRNVSTARELIRVVAISSGYAPINLASKTPQFKIQLRKRWLIFNNTNPIIGKRHEFIVSKTGYIRVAGGCVVMMLDTDKGVRTVIVLGSKNTRTRIPEAEFISAAD
jgi:D-alanyl-D-alanine endopeptidase (penicillin-binding protein 7)